MTALNTNCPVAAMMMPTVVLTGAQDEHDGGVDGEDVWA